MTNFPIFIGGLQRSGTSLMRAIVGSHPDIAIFQWDIPLWTKFFCLFRDQDLGDPDVLGKLLDTIFSSKQVKDCHVSLNRHAVEKRISEAAENELTCGLVFQCFLEEYARAVKRPRWGLKTPHNEFFAEDIFAAYPDARMVQLVRDPRDVAVSYQSYGGGAWNYSARDHMDKWEKSVALARINEKRYKGRYLCVRYEDLVNDPEQTIQDVCGILSIDFMPCMLEMTGQLGWKGNNSFFDDVGRQSKAISTAAMGRYRTSLKPFLIYEYQKCLNKDLLQLGYSIENFSFRERAGFSLKRLSQSVLLRITSFGQAIVSKADTLLKETPMHAPVRKLYRSVLESITQLYSLGRK